MIQDKTVMITGASGFIGKSLSAVLTHNNIHHINTLRDTKKSQKHTEHQFVINDINKTTDWSKALQNVSTIVHLAARVHVMNDHSPDPLHSFRAVNVDATLNLAHQAISSGVKRFIFLSSIKVNGESTNTNPFHSSDLPAPTDPYSISKLEAEKGLRKIALTTGLELVIIRPPLVYGSAAGGNFARLRQLTSKGYPLPFGAIHNKRSMIGIDNICDCIRVCLTHPDATKKPLLVSDNQDISSSNLMRLLASSHGSSIRLLPIPIKILHLVASFLGHSQEIKRLTENLQIDCSETMNLLNWKPPVSLETGIKRSIK